MDAKVFLEQLLQSARSLSDQGRDLAEEKFGLPESGEERDAMLSGMGKGALAAGALALLLGTGAGRRITGSALKLGGLAAVGAVAYQAFQTWQGTDADAGVPVDKLAPPEAEARSKVLAEAMIMAAMADGHIDASERARINQQIEQLGLATDTAIFIQERLANPIDVSALAAQADSSEAAAEMYVVSRLLIDPANRAERQYIERLAEALQLAPDLVGELERQFDTA
jgi:uncharacterized membrane protein YebE (DUF533 family)